MAGRDGKRHYVWTTYLMSHLVCNFQLGLRCPAHSPFVRCTSNFGPFGTYLMTTVEQLQISTGCF